MSDDLTEDFTPEEQAALSEMENETPETPEEQQKEFEAERKPEPETPEEQEAELQAEEKDAEFKSSRSEQMVPHQAMHAERMRRQEAERKLQELEERLSKIEQPAEQPPQFVDPLEDPEGFRKWAEYNDTQKAQSVEELKKQFQERQEQQQMIQKVQRIEAEFMEKQQDYPQATQFLQEQRTNELRMAGYSDQEIAQQISQDIRNIIQGAEMVGMNAAEVVYNRAKSMGYKPAQEVRREQQAQQVQAHAKAQQATQSLGHGGGETQSNGLTPDQLAEMSEDEFMALSDEEIAKALGA